MNLRTLARRSLRHYFRAHLGVLAGATLAAAVLIGALAVGDSVKGSLKQRALQRLARYSFALSTGDRFFANDLLARLADEDSKTAHGLGRMQMTTRVPWAHATALVLPGTLTRQDGTARANRVTVIGVNSNEFAVQLSRPPIGANQPWIEQLTVGYAEDGLWVNETLATQLSLKVGDAVILRLHKPSALSRDAVITPRDDTSVALRLKLSGIVPANMGGNLSLQANQAPPANVFVALSHLARTAGVEGKANLLLASAPAYQFDNAPWRNKVTGWLQARGFTNLAMRVLLFNQRPPADAVDEYFRKELDRSWMMRDVELSVRTHRPDASAGDGRPAYAELISSRIFLDPAATKASLGGPLRVMSALLVTNKSEFEDLLNKQPEPAPRLTFHSQPARPFPVSTEDSSAVLATNFVEATPILTYLVNSLSHGDSLTPYSMVTAAGAPYTPADLKDDEIVINQWLADDLGVKPGDTVTLAYYRVDAGTQLVEHTNTFRVHSIVPLAGLHADRTLMPEFPGLAKAESTHDWDAGFDLIHTIRDQDEAYWKQHRGTPKAFITLAAGQKLWANRFGDLTAIRWFVESPPSPRPSPPGRGGNAVSPSGSDSPASAPGASVSANEPAQTAAPVPPATKPATPASPSPGGEGRGEGGRSSSLSATQLRDAITARIRANLNPADVGLVWRPVREEALKAATSGQDFGGLFIGFSFFLIVAALLLTAMLFSFSLEQRATEAGILLALGWEPKRVRRVLFREGFTLAVLGTLLGAVVGVYYAKGVLWGLTTIWRDAVAGAGLEFHLTATTLLTGIGLSLAVAAVTMFLALRKQAKRPARELLNEGANESALNVAEGDSRRAKWVALGLVLAGGGLAAAAGTSGKPEMFFGAGALLLIGGLLWVRAWIRGLTPVKSSLESAAFGQRLERPQHSPSPGGEGRGEGGPIPFSPQAQGIQSDTRPHPNPLPQERGLTSPAPGSHQPTGTGSLRQLALRALARRPSRSLGTVALLASAAFLIIAVGANKLDATKDATKRSSGTGGFALWGESSLPVIQDLNTSKGRDFYGLDEDAVRGTAYVQFRVRDGDDASCLNLNRAQRPRLLGVRPEQLAERGAFTFTKLDKGLDVTNGWTALQSAIRNPQSAVPEIPAIGDANSIQWALGKKLGDTLDYVDERGQPFKVRIVGAVANSVLQGNLVIAESDFVRLFPSESGYRAFLIDAEAGKESSNGVGALDLVSAALSRALQDVGLELTPTARRLAQFNAVQNTYLNTFQILGGLGLLLGSVGLGVVVLRNVHERRGELGLMLALGFEGGALKRLVLTEHTALLLLGLAVGVIAALVAVLPALLSPGSEVPWGSLAITLGLVLANGLIWTVWATARSLRGRLVDALRAL